MIEKDLDTLLAIGIDQVTWYPLMVSDATRRKVTETLGRPVGGQRCQHAGQVGGRVLVEAVELGTEDRRQARAGVDHAGPLDVGGKYRLAAHLGGQVHAGHLAPRVAQLGLRAQRGLCWQRQRRRRRGQCPDALPAS